MRPISATLRIFFDDICSTVCMQLCFDMSRAKAGLSFPSCLCVFFVVSVCALVFVLFCVVFVIVLCFFLCFVVNVCCCCFLLFVFCIVCFLSFQLCVSKRPNWSAFLWSLQRSFCCLAAVIVFLNVCVAFCRCLSIFPRLHGPEPELSERRAQDPTGREWGPCA